MGGWGCGQREIIRYNFTGQIIFCPFPSVFFWNTTFLLQIFLYFHKKENLFMLLLVQWPSRRLLVSIPVSVQFRIPARAMLSWRKPQNLTTHNLHPAHLSICLLTLLICKVFWGLSFQLCEYILQAVETCKTHQMEAKILACVSHFSDRYSYNICVCYKNSISSAFFPIS